MSISETHKTWLYDVYEWRFSEGRFHSLLSLTSHSEEGGGEPRWLVFCDYLAKAMVNRSAEQGAGEIERQLHTWAMQLWGPGRLSREELAWEWFREQGPNEIIDRAFAVASLVGQHHDASLPPPFPNALSERLLNAPERAALMAYLVERHGPRDQVRVPVMLVNDSAAPGEQGRRSQLRLTPIRVPADQHGKLFRAPAALLLSLRQGDNTRFEDGLRKVERLLAACLTPPGADEGWGRSHPVSHFPHCVVRSHRPPLGRRRRQISSTTSKRHPEIDLSRYPERFGVSQGSRRRQAILGSRTCTVLGGVSLSRRRRSVQTRRCRATDSDDCRRSRERLTPISCLMKHVDPSIFRFGFP